MPSPSINERAHAGTLRDVVAKVCPVGSVSMGRFSDKTTWRITYLPEATQSQRAAAEAVIAAFDPMVRPPSLLQEALDTAIVAPSLSTIQEVLRAWRARF